jgi:hypothetical protein
MLVVGATGRVGQETRSVKNKQLAKSVATRIDHDISCGFSELTRARCRSSYYKFVVICQEGRISQLLAQLFLFLSKALVGEHRVLSFL